MTTYSIINLEPKKERPSDVGYMSVVRAVNQVGDAVGHVARNFLGNLYAIGGRVWHLPGAPPASPTADLLNTARVLDINDLGHCVGVNELSGGPPSPQPTVLGAFVLRDNVFIDLSNVVGTSSVATGVNNHGLVVGSSGIFQVETRAFVHDYIHGGTPIFIDPIPGQMWSTASAINQVGVVVGNSGSRGFSFSEGVLTDLGDLVARDINDAGHIVCTKTMGQSTRAVIYDPSRLDPRTVEIPLPPGAFSWSSGNSMNNNGDVVGSCGTPGGVDRSAYIYSQGRSTDLNTLIPLNIPRISEWILYEATDINDSGVIVGNGSLNGNPRAFALVPDRLSSTLRDIAVIFEVVGWLLNKNTDGGGVIFIGGKPCPIPPLEGPLADSMSRRGILLGMALEERANHIEDRAARLVARGAALELVRISVSQLIEILRR